MAGADTVITQLAVEYEQLVEAAICPMHSEERSRLGLTNTESPTTTLAPLFLNVTASRSGASHTHLVPMLLGKVSRLLQEKELW